METPTNDRRDNPHAPLAPNSALAIVTGGSRGIGLAVVEALLGAGWRVVWCSRSRQSVESAAETLHERLGEVADRARGEVVDVRHQEEVDAFVAGVLESEGRVDCLVNNAGLGHFAPVDELSGDEWRQQLEVNLSGPFYFTRAVAPAMRRQKSGWIFNVASLAGRNVFAGGAGYNASKFGLVALSEASMLDLRADGVRVTAVLPGSVDTDFHSGDDRGWMLAPEDVAQVVLDCLRFPSRALPSLIELRPARTKNS